MNKMKKTEGTRTERTRTEGTRTERTTRRAGVAIAMLVAVLASVFALPSFADAQEAGEVTVEGSGWLYAVGTGNVDITMGGRLRLHVDGDVTVIDNAGDMRVRLRGASASDEEERSTNVSLTDFRGFVNVRGSDFTVMVDGRVVLNAHGRGQAALFGAGTYKTRHGDRTAWDGVVELGIPEVTPVG